MINFTGLMMWLGSGTEATWLWLGNNNVLAYLVLLPVTNVAGGWKKSYSLIKNKTYCWHWHGWKISWHLFEKYPAVSCLQLLKSHLELQDLECKLPRPAVTPPSPLLHILYVQWKYLHDAYHMYKFWTYLWFAEMLSATQMVFILKQYPRDHVGLFWTCNTASSFIC